MKGLEISEVKASDLNAECRLDAEYFSKWYIEANRLLDAFGVSFIGDCVTDGIHTSIDYDDSSKVNLISAMSPQENVFDLSRRAHISELMHKANPRTALRKGDVIVSTVGTIGNAAVVDETVLPANCDRDVGIIRREGYSPYVLSTFLLTKYGKAQTVRESTGNVQLHLFIYKMRGLKIPDFSIEFQARVEQCVKEAHGKINEANEAYREAEQMLLAELGFAGWSPTDDSVSVKRYSDFVSAGRFDAEYFQPKYEDIDKKICRYRGGVVAASDALVSGLVKEDAETEERYVELADIGANGEITGCMSAAFGELPSRARQRIEVGQVIASSIEGSLDKCALVTPEYGNALCSTGFHRFCSAKINSETMLLLFKSWPIQQLMKRGCSGTILCGILAGELTNVPLPLVDARVQRDLADKVQSSFALRAESKQLLNLAKRTVEIAIEHSEEKAIRLMDNY